MIIIPLSAGAGSGRLAGMTNRERIKLLFGPYEAPPLKRGDRAVCLFRCVTKHG
jgi:hypothetical protein